MSNLPPSVRDSDPNAPWNEKELPLKKCDNCEGTGYESTICTHCGYDLKHDFTWDTGATTDFGPDDPCPSCRHNDCLSECSECDGKGERKMTQEEYDAYIEHLKYGNYEKY